MAEAGEGAVGASPGCHSHAGSWAVSLRALLCGSWWDAGRFGGCSSGGGR